MKSMQRDVGAAAARLFAAAAPVLFSKHPLSAVATTVRLVSREQAVPTRDAAQQASTERFWYYVAPQVGGDAWSVLFEGQPRSYGYESQDEALKAACRAAEAMHRRHQTAAGVRVRRGEDWRDAVKFGTPVGSQQQ